MAEMAPPIESSSRLLSLTLTVDEWLGDDTLAAHHPRSDPVQDLAPKVPVLILADLCIRQGNPGGAVVRWLPLSEANRRDGRMRMTTVTL